MALKTYLALRTESKHEHLHNKHLTCAFMPVQPTRYLHMSSIMDYLPSKAIVKGIEYWPQAGVTVAIIAQTPTMRCIQLALAAAGWTYSDYEWNPHVTLWYEKNDRTDKFQHLIGAELTFTDAYIRIKEYN